MKKESDNNPIKMIVIILLIAVVCVCFPLQWLKNYVGQLNAMAIIRFVFAAVGLIFMLMFGFWRGFKTTFKINKSTIKYLDIIIICLLVAANNFPIIALIRGDVKVFASSAEILSYVFFCLSVGFFEEIFFRGNIFCLCKIFFKNKKNSGILSILLSSAIFGMFHLINLFNGASLSAVIIQIGYSFLIGAVCALLYYLTEKLFFAIIMHTIYNIGGLMVGNIANGEIWNTETVILTAVFSVIAGIYIIVRFIRKEMVYAQ